MENYRKKIYDNYVSDHSYQFFDFSKDEYNYYAKEFKMNYSGFLPKDRNALILELGCGPGHFLYYLEQELFSNYIGVDCSSEQLRLGEKVCKGRLIKEDIVKFLELSSERFDLVIMRHVLEHFKKEEILHLLNLVLLHIKDKGKFIVEVPNCSSPLFGAYNQSADFTHEVGFTGESLREILKTAGFHNVHVGPYKVKPKAKRLIFSMLNNIMKIISNKEIYFDSAIFAIAEKSF